MSSNFGLDLDPDYFANNHGGDDYTPLHQNRFVCNGSLVYESSTPESVHSTISHIKQELKNEDCSKSKEKKQTTQKHPQVTATLKWLHENYEDSDGVCLQRCVVYTHYLQFCKANDLNPSGPATFGKIIRQKFHKVTTRRLGTRGQSKYHYYGIGIKESSVHYQSVYTGTGLTRFSGIKIKTEGSHKKYSLGSHTGTLLPDFPDISNFILPSSIDRDKMSTFFMMYRTHCQRILDTIISSHFEEIDGLLLHFWQGMPEHLHEILDNRITSDVISLCDSVMYKVLVDVLIPPTIQDLPQSLENEIEEFITKLPQWVRISVEEIPINIQNAKLNDCQRFVKIVKRHFSFIHLAQTARSVLLNTDSVNTMMKDLGEIELPEITSQLQFIHSREELNRLTISELFETFKVLLLEQTSIECLVEWLDEVIDKYVLKRSKITENGFDDAVAADFLLHWSFIGAFILRDLTLNSASSFGSLHLLHMMLDEYIFLVVETQQYKRHNEVLQTNLQKYMIQSEITRTQEFQKERVNPEHPVGKFEDAENVHKSQNDTLKASKTRGNVAFIKPFPVVRHERVIDHSEFSSRYPSNPQGSCDPPFSSVKPLSNENGHFSADYRDGNSNSSYPQININSALPVPRFPVVTYQQPHSQVQCFSPFTANWQPTSAVDRYSYNNRSLPVGNVPIHHVTYGCQGLENYSRSNFYQKPVSYQMPSFSSCPQQGQYPYHQHQHQIQSLPYNSTVSHPYQFIKGNT